MFFHNSRVIWFVITNIANLIRKSNTPQPERLRGVSAYSAKILLASNLLYAADVTATLEIGVKECINNSDSLVV